MYFNSETQARIMARFYFSVNPGGFLVLGRAEMLFSYASTFQAVDLKRRIFKTIPKAQHRDRLLPVPQPEREDRVPQDPDHNRLRDAAFEMSPDAQIVVDNSGVLVAANAIARRSFSLGEGELARPLQDLEISYYPAELRNDELRSRTLELNASHAFLEAVFTSLRSAVIVVDRNLRIKVVNAGALDMWGVRPDEATGLPLFKLDIGLPIGDLHQPVREILAGTAVHHDLNLPATNRRGRAIRCRISIAPLLGDDKSLTGAILMMDDEAPA